MAAHTPGPWYVPEYAPWQIQRVGALGGYTAIATTNEDVHDGRSKAEAYANALLIAASPDLLTACKDLMIFVERAFDVEHSTTGLQVLVLAASEAIAKAEGES